MRVTRFRLFLLCGGLLLLLGPATVLSQPGGAPGGFPGGAPGGAPGGFPGGGRNRGGPGGAPGGGGFRFDPTRIFDMISGGKDVIVVADMLASPMIARDPTAKDAIESFMQRQGITNGQLTRDQFSQYMTERIAQRGGGRPGGPGGPPGATTPGSPIPVPDDNTIRGWFKRLDANSDGVLSGDEIPPDMRPERDKWDANHNGTIEFDEYKAYVAAKFAAGTPPPESGMDIVGPVEDDLDKRPTVYRVGKLPKGLPQWYEQLDTDKDGQIGLYEWKAANRPVADFQAIDTNGDGFITVEEALKWQKKNSGKADVATGGAPGIPGGSPGFTGSPGGFLGGSPGGFPGGGRPGGGRRRNNPGG